MNELVTRKQLATFQVESFANSDGMRVMIAECLKIYAEAWEHGISGRSGAIFDPDVEVIVGMVASGVRRFVTARVDGEIVAMQHWIVVNDIESRRRRIAHMTAIYKRSPEVCDTVEFIKFGIAAMRAAGANNVIMQAYTGAKGLREKMEAAGAKVVEYVMEA